MSSSSLTTRILCMLGEERRRVVSGWRIELLRRRLPNANYSSESLQRSARRLISSLLKTQQVVAIEGVQDVYRVQVPFANAVDFSEEQVIMEANPWAVLSHLTALAHHTLTDQIPKSIQALSYPREVRSRRLPLGTTPEDWYEFPLPPVRMPKHIEKIPVRWTRMGMRFDFGHMVSYSHGVPIWVTDVERTLLDALRAPSKVKGFGIVLSAWRRGASIMNLDKLTEYAEQFQSPLMRQRVGFVLESMRLAHPALERWRRKLQRGSSMKLIADAEFSSTYSERWNLSLNVPESVLAELAE